MIKPEFRTTRFRKLCLATYKFFDAWYVKYVVGPVFFVVPVTFFGMVVTRKQLLADLPYGDQLANYQIPLILVFVMSLVVSRLIFAFIKEYSKPNSCVTSDEILAIVSAVDSVVDSKNHRFLEATKRSNREKWDAQQTFNEITKPEQQIALLVYAIQGVFEFVYNQEVQIKVGLMEIVDDRPTEWFAFAPKDLPPRTGPQDLSTKSSAIMRALESGGLVIVGSIKKELQKSSKRDRKCVKGRSDDNNGSLMAIPIYCPNTRQAIYVLSIKADIANTFLKDEAERYRWIFQAIFFKRIILEHHLLLMRRGVENDEYAG